MPNPLQYCTLCSSKNTDSFERSTLLLDGVPVCFLCYQTYTELHPWAMRGHVDARKWTDAAHEKMKRWQSPSFADLLEYAAQHWAEKEE